MLRKCVSLLELKICETDRNVFFSLKRVHSMTELKLVTVFENSTRENFLNSTQLELGISSCNKKNYHPNFMQKLEFPVKIQTKRPANSRIFSAFQFTEETLKCRNLN